MTDINRQNKDRLFRFIFGNPENKAWTLSLYNAINGSDYTDPDAIMITTIKDALYMGMKNDVSFIIGETLNLYEQQATYNPNMPVRFLIYVGMVYSNYIDVMSNNINIYSSKQQMLPVPKLICFYNGSGEKDESAILKLSSAFPKNADADIEVKVKILNINYGKNMALLNHCRPLREYSFFIERVRYWQERMDNLDEAVDHALDELPDESEIKKFLLSNKAEVKRMCITEYDETRTMNMFREEYREEGLAEGRAEGRVQGRAEGENKLGNLITILIKQGRTDDIGLAAQDPDYRNKLYQEFQIA